MLLGRVDGSIYKHGFLNGKYKESVILPGTRINRIGSKIEIGIIKC